MHRDKLRQQASRTQPLEILYVRWAIRFVENALVQQLDSSPTWLRTTIFPTISEIDDLLHNMTLGDGVVTTNTSSVVSCVFLSLFYGLHLNY